MPIRIQRKRTKGWKKPDNTVYVGRGSKWGNPFVVGGVISTKQLIGDSNQIFIKDNEAAIYYFRRYLTIEMKLLAKMELKGKNLMCWCPLDRPCHADVLLEMVKVRIGR